MISPSKAQHQQRKQSTRDNSDSHSHVRLQKGRKPLERKSFYLDIKNHALASNLEAKIKDLGGITELFLIKSVTLVVTDKSEKLLHNNNSDKKKWVSGSGESGGPPSLRSIEVPTPIATPPTPFGVEYPLSNSTNIRGQTVQRSKSRADAMLERALTQPQQCSVDPLNNAQNWGIPIWATKKLQCWLDKIYESLKETGNSKYPTEQSSNTEKTLKVKQLKNSYIKFESFKRDTRPVFLELPIWPTINFDGDSGTCPFDTRIREKKACKEDNSTFNKEKGKEMTRRPRATATRARRTEQLVAGYCEMCRIDYRDLSKHVQSEKHMSFVRNDDNFLSLDKLINSGASVEAFLRANEVGEDCNIYPDGDSSIYTVNSLEDEKLVKSSSKQEISKYEMSDELNLVDCSVARRSMSIKLSSANNLRARSKHESGHLLRSKGSPWDSISETKSEKYYDKYEGYTIKKRAKGTIWLEEDDEMYKKSSRKLEKSQENRYAEDIKPSNLLDSSKSVVDRLPSKFERSDPKIPAIGLKSENSLVDEAIDANRPSSPENLLVNDEDASNDCKNGFNGFERVKLPESFPENQLPGNSFDKLIEPKKSLSHESLNETFDKPEKSVKKLVKRKIRGFRGRPRLSVEERLIEDNRAYYKVEVLGNKLRSSTGPWNIPIDKSPTKSLDKNLPQIQQTKSPNKTIDDVSSEKPVVVRFKRVRRSELSLLSDEAESFMFGEQKRDDDETSSELSENETSLLPNDTETSENIANSSSSTILPKIVKQEPLNYDDDKEDSCFIGKARKRRRTQAEMLLEDNEEYYTFETPGSRLRFQGISNTPENLSQEIDKSDDTENKIIEKLYPSKPSAEIEKMLFSFETVPKSEPWYKTYQRQDEGSEYWHYFSETDDKKPFLLPYEIDNFHDTLTKLCIKNDTGKKKNPRFINGIGRSPRKSPRCHASTLAIMSTIIRKQQFDKKNLSTIDEDKKIDDNTKIPKNFDKIDDKFNNDTDVELREIAKSIDDMLSADSSHDDTFENNLTNIDEVQTITEKRGPPNNLIDLLDNCNDYLHFAEYSSYASSDCGDNTIDSPLKRRKKRKNRTGWPGIKIRKKLHNKHLNDTMELKKIENDVIDILNVNFDDNNEIINRDTKNFAFNDEYSNDFPKNHNNDNIYDIQLNVVKKSDISENSNDENHDNTSRSINSKSPRKRPAKINDSNDSNDFILTKNSNSTIISRNTINNCCKKRQRETSSSGNDFQEASENNISNDISNNDVTSSVLTRKKQLITKLKRQRINDRDFDDENSKTDKTKKRNAESIDSDLDSIAERVSPSLIPTTELQNRRSSIEFQPVVRMMKIEDQVDMENSIISVTVASNRRLRSSTSPRNNKLRETTKRYKRSKGPFGRWIKNSL